MSPSLETLFNQVNETHFEGLLAPPSLRWNSRLRSSAGRFIPPRRRWGAGDFPVIEVASYLLREENALALIVDTLGHEMIHLWLWLRRRPYGHTPEFYRKMREMGASRYNPVPRARPYKYLYRCVSCQKEFPARKKLGPLACASCCNRHANGQYDSRFKLFLARVLSQGEELPLS